MTSERQPEVRDLLEVVEAHLAAPAEYLAEGRALAALNEALAALEDAVDRCPAEATALAERLARARALAALRTRRLPDGALEGVYEAVRARMAGAVDEGDRALLRAGLSRSFLDAPRALAWWRRTAVAAVALVALGLGWWASTPVGDGPGAGSGGEPLRAYDPRDDLLRRLRADPVEPGGVGDGDGRFLPMEYEDPRRRDVFILRGSSAGSWENELKRRLAAPARDFVERN